MEVLVDCLLASDSGPTPLSSRFAHRLTESVEFVSQHFHLVAVFFNGNGIVSRINLPLDFSNAILNLLRAEAKLRSLHISQVLATFQRLRDKTVHTTWVFRVRLHCTLVDFRCATRFGGGEFREVEGRAVGLHRSILHSSGRFGLRLCN